MIKEKLLSTGLFEDNDYFNEYINLIHNNVVTKVEKFKTNRHHIIPVSYFKRIGKDVDNSDENMVNLYFSEHVKAHYLLYFCTSNDYDKYSNACAIRHLCGLSKRRKIDFDIDSLNLDRLQELYEEARIMQSSKMIGRFSGENNPTKRPDVREKISRIKMGHEVSEEARRKIGEKNRGKKRKPYNYTLDGYKRLCENKLGDNNPAKREEIRKINSEKHMGKIFITNGMENKTIYPSEFSKYVEFGYRRGVTRGLHNIS